MNLPPALNKGCSEGACSTTNLLDVRTAKMHLVTLDATSDDFFQVIGLGLADAILQHNSHSGHAGIAGNLDSPLLIQQGQRSPITLSHKIDQPLQPFNGSGVNDAAKLGFISRTNPLMKIEEV